MLPIDTLIPFTLASTLLALAPGPDNIFVLMQSALLGRKNGLFVTLGLCTGLIFHTSAVAFGVAALFQVSATAFTILKAAGATYLLYLAWQAFKASAENLEGKSVKPLSAARLYGRGIIMNITNPKVSIFFLAFLPQFTSPNHGSIAFQVMVLGLVFILTTFLVFGTIALAAGSLGTLLNRSPRIQVWLNRTAGTVFAGLALKLATTSMD